MGLRATIAKAVDVAFVATDDIPVSGTLTHYVGAPTYNPTTGVNSRTIDSEPDFTGILLTNERKESRAMIEAADKFYLIRQNEVPLVSVDDELTIGSNVLRVLDFSEDPAGVTWTIHTRVKS